LNQAVRLDDLLDGERMAKDRHDDLALDERTDLIQALRAPLTVFLSGEERTRLPC
jgi:hypothetical protein